jgi:hypothetical protein
MARDVKREAVGPPGLAAGVGASDPGALATPGMSRSRDSQANVISTMTTSEIETIELRVMRARRDDVHV